MAPSWPGQLGPVSSVDGPQWREGAVEIRGIQSDVFHMIVRRVSVTRYDGNIICKDPRPTILRKDGSAFRQRVIAISSKRSGARRSASGRRMPCACWHVFRDVVRATFENNPGVTFRTSLAYYTSGNFETTYPATGAVNVGSMFRPAYLPELCECDDDDNGAEPVPVDMAVCRSPILATIRTDHAPSASRQAERDQELAIAAHECAWCGGSTAGMGEVFAWCSQECQTDWQAKYGAGLATR